VLSEKYMETTIKDNWQSLKTGNIRLFRLKRIYEELGYLVISRASNHEGVDLVVIALPDGRIKKAIEVTNYARKDEYIDNNRFVRYLDSLCYFENIEGIELELVVSFAENINLKQYEELKKYNIKVTEVGHQDTEEEENVEGWSG